MWGALILSPTQRRREKPAAQSRDGQTRRGGVRRPRAPEGCGGVSEHAPSRERSRHTATPGLARRPHAAHTWSGLACWSERRAVSGARSRGRERESGVFTSLPLFLSSASRCLEVGAGL